MATSKKGRISRNESYIIHGLLSDGKSTEFIAKELGRPEKIINKYIDSKHKENDVQAIETEAKPKRRGPSTLDLMTSDRDIKGQRPVIMTKAASERADEMVKPDGGFGSRHDGCLFDAEGNSLTKK